MQILDISDADSIGENLAEIQFYILSISDPTAPVVVNSTTVTEIYELANVDEISGYTVSISKTSKLCMSIYNTFFLVYVCECVYVVIAWMCGESWQATKDHTTTVLKAGHSSVLSNCFYFCLFVYWLEL